MPWQSLTTVHAEQGRIDVLGSEYPASVMTSYASLWWATPVATMIYLVFAVEGKEVLHAWAELLRCTLSTYGRGHSLDEETPPGYCQSILPEMKPQHASLSFM
jgi:hypothetical protein